MTSEAVFFLPLQFAKEQRAATASSMKLLEIPSPVIKGYSSTAEHLIRFALARLADRMSIRLGHPVDATFLERMPINRRPAISSCEATPLDAIGIPYGQGDDLIRSDVHGDLACCVMSFTWPAAFPPPPPQMNRKGDHRVINVASEEYMDYVTRFRWAQLRFITEFEILHRREIRLRWQETATAVTSQARMRKTEAREKERIERSLAGDVFTYAHKSMVGPGKRGPRGNGNAPPPIYDVNAVA